MYQRCCLSEKQILLISLTSLTPNAKCNWYYLHNTLLLCCMGWSQWQNIYWLLEWWSVYCLLDRFCGTFQSIQMSRFTFESVLFYSESKLLLFTTRQNNIDHNIYSLTPAVKIELSLKIREQVQLVYMVLLSGQFPTIWTVAFFRERIKNKHWCLLRRMRAYRADICFGSF